MALKTILIVDDIKSARTLLLKQLKHEDYELLEAQNGAEALELIRRRPVDLVISDLVMPEMDGIELLENIRAETDLPFIMLTVKDSVDCAVQAMRKGADDYVTRPYKIDELRLLIQHSVQI